MLAMPCVTFSRVTPFFPRQVGDRRHRSRVQGRVLNTSIGEMVFPERFCSDDTDLNLLFCDDKDVLEYAHSRESSGI